MKQIEIENCQDCKHCYPIHTQCELKHRRIDVPYRLKIPDWCPLPDVEEKKEEKGSYKDNFPKISPDDFAKARDSIGLRFNR